MRDWAILAVAAVVVAAVLVWLLVVFAVPLFRPPHQNRQARRILRRDTEKYDNHRAESGWVVFDRGLVEALGMLHESSPLSASELAPALAAHPFHSSVFVLQPWKEIYTTDSERDHSFRWLEYVHRQVVQWYRSCGYVLHEVPRLPVAARAEFVLRALEHAAASPFAGPDPLRAASPASTGG